MDPLGLHTLELSTPPRAACFGPVPRPIPTGGLATLITRLPGLSGSAPLTVTVYRVSIVLPLPPSAMIVPRRLASTASFTAAPPLYRLLKLALSRFSTAAAAQPHFDHDYYYGHRDDRGLRLDQLPVAGTEGSVPVRGVQWAFIGSPISKRHVYAERLSKLLEVPHISMAGLVRQDLNPRSSLYKQIANAVNRGELVPEEILFGLLSKRLEDGYCRGESGFILDGIPRSRIQAEILSELVEIDLVVNFKCKEHCLAEHEREGAWREKLRIFAEQSKPLEDYYKKRDKLLDFQVSSAPGETWKGLLATLHLHSSLL